MGFRRKLRWLILVLMPLFLFTGCGDLEPDMQDTRTVILKMDFHGKSSSRSSSSVSASELSQYNTHLILALPSGENLTSSEQFLSDNYKDFHSSFAQGLMNTADKTVYLEIPQDYILLNKQMKIFAFLFEENYSMSELFSGVREVGYYGESQTFSIGTQTNNLSLGITLIPVFDQGVEYMTACTTSYPSNTRKSVKFLSANTLEYTISPVTYQNASDCTNKVNGTRTAYSFIFNYATTPTYTVSNQEGQTGLTAYYGTWALSSSPSSPTYWMLIYPKDTNEFWIGFGTDESSAKALNMLYGGDGSSIDNKYTK